MSFRVFTDLLKSHNPDFVFLLETLFDANVMQELVVKVEFDKSFEVNRVGRGGCLTIIWKKLVKCSVIQFLTFTLMST